MTDYSISTCIRNDKPLKRNNKYPVYLRVRVYNRETKVPTNIEVDKNGWDVKRREPKEKSLKIVLSKKILGLESYLNNCIASDTELSIELVKDFFSTKKHVHLSRILSMTTIWHTWNVGKKT